jgi:hypothetical protein
MWAKVLFLDGFIAKFRPSEGRLCHLSLEVAIWA